MIRRGISLLLSICMLAQSVAPALANDRLNSVEDIQRNLENLRKFKSVSAPLDFQSDPKDTAAGILHWAIKDGKAYILMGKRNDSKDKEFGEWCNFGGKSSKKALIETSEVPVVPGAHVVPEVPETIVETAIREVQEESNGIFAIHPRLLRKLPFTATYSPKEQEGLLYYMYWQKVQYLEPKIFMDKVTAATESHNKEYTDFLWVDADLVLKAVEQKSSLLVVDGRKIEIFNPFFQNLSTDSGLVLLCELSNHKKIRRFKKDVRTNLNRLYVLPDGSDTDSGKENNQEKEHAPSKVHWDVPVPSWVVKNDEKKWVPNNDVKWWNPKAQEDKDRDPRKYTPIPFGQDAFGRDTNNIKQEKSDFAEAVAAHGMAMVQIKRRFHKDVSPQSKVAPNWNPNCDETLSRIHLRGVLGNAFKAPKVTNDKAESRATDIENIKAYFEICKVDFKRTISLLESDYEFFADILEYETQNRAWPTFFHGATTHINNLYKSFTYLRELIDVRSLKNLMVLRGTDIYFKDDATMWGMLNRLGTSQSLTSNLMLFVNFVLFAGLNTTTSASSSPEYVINNHNVSPPNIEEKFEESLALAGFESPIYAYFHSIYQQFIEFKNKTASNSVMYTISQSPEGLDECNYPCHPGGSYCMDDNKSTQKVLGGIQGQLAQQQKGDQKPLKEKDCQEKDSFKTLFPENRLFLHPTVVMDPTKLIIKDFLRFSLSPEEERVYDKEMRLTTVAMLADWLAQETCVIEGSFVNSPVLKTLYKMVYKGLAGVDLKERPSYDGFIYLIMNHHVDAAVKYLEYYPEILTKVDLTPLKNSSDQNLRTSLVAALLPNRKTLPAELSTWFSLQIYKMRNNLLEFAKLSEHESLFKYILEGSDELSWAGNYLDDHQVDLIINALSTNTTLKKIKFTDRLFTKIIDGVFKGDGNAYLGAPWFLDISGQIETYFCKEMTSSLAAALVKNTQVKRLNLWNCCFSEAAVPILTEGLKQNTSLEEVILPDAVLSSVTEQIGADTPTACAPWLKATVQSFVADPIKIIRFDANHSRWDHLVATLRTTTVEELDLTSVASEYFNLPWIDKIVEGLQGNATLRSVKMKDNEWVEVFTQLMTLSPGPFTRAPWFVEAREGLLQNPDHFLKFAVKQRYSPGVLLVLRESPKEIVLKAFMETSWWNRYFWMNDLIQGLERNENYTHLNFTELELSSDDLQKLFTALRNNTKLKTLNLSGCRIWSDGAQAIAEFLRDNKTLEKLTLSFEELIRVMGQLEKFPEGFFKQSPWYSQAWQEVWAHPQELIKLADRQTTPSLIEQGIRGAHGDSLNLGLLREYTLVTPVLEGLKANRTIKNLIVLHDTFSDPQRMRSLVQVLQANTSLEKLEFWGRCGLSKETLTILTEALQKIEGLKELVLPDNLQVLNALYRNRNLCPIGIQSWVERGLVGLKSNKTQSLWSTMYHGFEDLTSYLCENEPELMIDNISEGLMVSLCKTIGSGKALTQLDLQFSSSFYFFSSPIKSLREALHNAPHIHTLRLGGNRYIDEREAKEVASLLRENIGMLTLDMSQAVMDSKGMSALVDGVRATQFSKVLKVPEKNERDLLEEVIACEDMPSEWWCTWRTSAWAKVCTSLEESLSLAIISGHKNLATAILKTGNVRMLDLKEKYLNDRSKAVLVDVLMGDKTLQTLKLGETNTEIFMKLLPHKEKLSKGAKTWVNETLHTIMQTPGAWLSEALRERWGGNVDLAKYILSTCHSLVIPNIDGGKIESLSKLLANNTTLTSLTLVGELYEDRCLRYLYKALKENPKLPLKHLDLSKCVLMRNDTTSEALEDLKIHKNDLTIIVCGCN